MSDEPSGRQDQLYHELNESLHALLSDEQIQFCIDHGVASALEMQRFQETLGQVRRFIGVIGLAGSSNSDSLRQTFLRTLFDFSEFVKRSCRHRRIRSMSKATVAELELQWEQLSNAFDDKTKEHAILTRLVSDVQLLKKAWRHSTQVESVLASILASSSSLSNTAIGNNPHSYYVAAIDRRNYAQLGLHRKSLGSRQIVFECARVTREEQISAIVDICNRFQTIFMQNAQQNLVGIQSQLDIARPSQLARQLKRFYDHVFYQPGDNDEEEEDEKDGQQQQRRQRVLSYQSVGAGARMTTPFRLTLPMTTPSFIWYPSDQHDGEDDFPITALPPPSFVPAPWQWTDLIRPRTPYHAIFFGLIRRRKQPLYRGWGPGRRRREQEQPSFSRPLPAQGPSVIAGSGTEAGMSASRIAEAGDVEEPEEERQQQSDTAHSDGLLAGEQGEFATVSVEDLSKHFSRIGRQFYEDVANNANLGYRQDSRIIEGIGQDLVEIYTSLQLETLRLDLNKIMALGQEIANLQQQQPIQGAPADTSSSAAAVRPSVPSM